MSSISKKRVNDIKELLKNTYGNEKVDEVMNKILEIFNFDPNKSTYTPEMGKKLYEKMKQKSKESGTSLYILSGRKKHYEKSKLSNLNEST